MVRLKALEHLDGFQYSHAVRGSTSTVRPGGDQGVSDSMEQERIEEDLQGDHHDMLVIGTTPDDELTAQDHTPPHLIHGVPNNMMFNWQI